MRSRRPIVLCGKICSMDVWLTKYTSQVWVSGVKCQAPHWYSLLDTLTLEHMTLEHVILLFLLPQQIAQFQQAKPQTGLHSAERLIQTIGDLRASHAAIVG